MAFLGLAARAQTPTAPPFDAAAAFGARENVLNLSLAPDGATVAFVAATPGAGSAVFTLALKPAARPVPVLVANSNPDRLAQCNWVANDRLACQVYGVVAKQAEILPYSRLVAVDSDGANQKPLSTVSNSYTHYYQLGGGGIVDLLPDLNGMILMSRHYVPDDHAGSIVGSKLEGMGIDQIDTRTLATKRIEPPNQLADEYLSDGHGTIRVMGLEHLDGGTGQMSGLTDYYYRAQASRDWHPLSSYDSLNRTGFAPLAVDRDRNIAYGVKKQDGRSALYSIVLDGSMQENLVFARPDVDVDELVLIGRRNRAVGVNFATEFRNTIYFDQDIAKEVKAIQNVLPMRSMVGIVDSSADERKLLVFASRDDNPGVYYIYDRQQRTLETLFATRSELRGVRLAKVQAVNYQARDGTAIPAYLTLPPGVEVAKGLPSIVMPHGGPSARDYWGFDWLAQFFAARGYVVIQPNYRGSAGYGDSWYENNGFQSWPVAISDVLDAGRWLVSQGIADPARLGIVGWSYGGYAALQSAVVDPGLFKAVVAIAPVTDLQQLKDDRQYWTDHEVVSRFVGTGPHVRQGSPARNADKIKAPVLLFQGTFDRNVTITHSRMMARSLHAAKVPSELVTYDGLDHQIDDSNARTDMLRKSDAFLRKAFGM
jgi:acetyl esterase/lipase